MPQSRQLFTNRDTWNGGFYELCLQLGTRSDERLSAVLERVWLYPALDGCYLAQNIEPRDQQRISPSLSVAENRHLLGVATLRSGRRVACGTFIHRPPDGGDFLGFYFPMGALQQASPAVGRRDTARFTSVDRWLVLLAGFIYAAQPFEMGLLGFEALDSVTAPGFEKSRPPDERYVGYLLPQEGTLQYFPANRGYE